MNYAEQRRLSLDHGWKEVAAIGRDRTHFPAPLSSRLAARDEARLDEAIRHIVFGSHRPRD